MRVYIASSHRHVDAAIRLAKTVEDMGIENVASWMFCDIGYGTEMPDYHKAHRDVVELTIADVLVVLAWEGSGGGMHNEVGFALAQRKPIIMTGDHVGMLGRHQRIFHELTVDDLLRRLSAWKDPSEFLYAKELASFDRHYKQIQCEECGRWRVLALGVKYGPQRCMGCGSKIEC